MIRERVYTPFAERRTSPRANRNASGAVECLPPAVGSRRSGCMRSHVSSGREIRRRVVSGRRVRVFARRTNNRRRARVGFSDFTPGAGRHKRTHACRRDDYDIRYDRSAKRSTLIDKKKKKRRVIRDLSKRYLVIIITAR